VVLRADGSEKWRPARIAVVEPFGDATQQYRRLAFRVRELADAREARSIVVTSAQSGDGKTTTSCNLAVQLVRLDRALRVVLVDLDLRRGSIAAAFGIEVPVSVNAVLRGERSVEEAILDTDIPGLSILALSRVAEDPESLLAQSSLSAMIRELEREYDFVLIDTPPVLAVSDVQVILRHTSAGLFVARAGQTPVKAIRRALEHLPARKMLGSFLNSRPKPSGLTGYSYYGYGYGAPSEAEAAEGAADPREHESVLDVR
jgi:capsular exopolysaccharide synthesis family protein